MTKKLLTSVFKLNLLFCAGVLIVDTYGKICDIHKKITIIYDALSKSDE